MKLSLRWVEEFTTLKIDKEDLVSRIGAQLGAIEGIEEWGDYYDDGICVAEIVEANDHPDADKLGVYVVDVGSDKRTVCAGDKSLQVGDKVAYIPPGCRVPVSVRAGDPFTIEKRELRGVESDGMLGSGQELIINDNHDGVLVLDTDAKPGSALSEAYSLNDTIIDIENKMFTHRPDLFGILGLARELAGIQDIAFVSPDWYTEDTTFGQPERDLPLQVRVEIPELCPRFSVLTYADVEIKPSPLKMQSYLMRVGLRPINNIVDITNFAMYVTAQPTHVFDYDKVAKRSKDGATIVVRKPKDGESVKLLDGRVIIPHADAAMVATDQELISVGGSMGGADTEIDESTKNIILEAANWDLYSIRRSSFAHGIFTDAVTRFNKGQSPRQTLAVLGWMQGLLEEYAGATQASALIDVYDRKDDAADIAVESAFVNTRLGSDFKPGRIAHILDNVELAAKTNGTEIAVAVPFWRTDLHVGEDIVEEVGRLYGYDNLPINSPSRLSIPNLRSEELALKGRVRSVLAAAGARDVLTYNFVPQSLFARAGYGMETMASAYKLRNSLSPELEYMRMSILPSLVDKVHANVRAGDHSFVLFEINKSHSKQYVEDGLPVELTTIALLVASDQEQPGSPFYQAKAYLQHLVSELHQDMSIRTVSDGDASTQLGGASLPLLADKRRAAVDIDGKFAGFVGELSARTKQQFKLPNYVAGFEIMLKRLSMRPATYAPISKYPASTQDVTLATPNEIDFADVCRLVQTSLKSDDFRLHTKPIGIYRATSQDSHRNITLRMTFQSDSRTLKTAEINLAIEQFAAKAAELGIRRV